MNQCFCLTVTPDEHENVLRAGGREGRKEGVCACEALWRVSLSAAWDWHSDAQSERGPSSRRRASSELLGYCACCVSMPHVWQRRASAICALLEGLLTCRSCIKQTQFPGRAKQKKKKKVDSALLWSDLEQIFLLWFELDRFHFYCWFNLSNMFFFSLFKYPILLFSQVGRLIGPVSGPGGGFNDVKQWGWSQCG